MQSFSTYFWWKTGFRVIGRISIDILPRNVYRPCQGNPNPGDDRLTARFWLSAWNVVHITMHVTVGRTSSQIQLQIAYIWASVRLFTLFFDRIRISWNKQVFVIESFGNIRFFLLPSGGGFLLLCRCSRKIIMMMMIRRIIPPTLLIAIIRTGKLSERVTIHVN